MPKVELLLSVQSGIRLSDIAACAGVIGECGGKMRGAIKGFIRHILEAELPHCRCVFEVSLLVCDDGRITELNREHFGRDCPTDVISFPQLSRDELERLKNAHACKSEPTIPLGDVIISADAIRRQASRYRHSQFKEFMRLLAHGVLHLLGYDDATEDQRKAMWARERMLLRVWMSKGSGLSSR